ncbi:DUF1648 domain-containing protein [Bacillus mycoides]|uniref:DUF1648 domain-containing protein n=1 Tax=Bacillus mycoides TaxID=1405 RepID=UPI0003E25BF1|nr:DUF5808 domain-containing protein [Bacillus mycoides]ETT84683.1 hypothetical protein C174_02294 [Bacillus mycoides FSL H7-687]
MNLIIFSIVIVFVTAIEIMIPFLMKENIIFGVSIPEENIKNIKLTSYKKIYSRSIFIVFFVLIVLYLFWGINKNLSEELIALFGIVIQSLIIFISMILYFYFHGKVMKQKVTHKWGEDLKEVKIADLTIRSRDEMLPWYIYVLPIAVTVGLISYTALQYNNLPQQIPIHWGADGKPDSFTTKSLFSVHLSSIILLTIQIMFLAIHEATKRSGIKLSATRTNLSGARQLNLRKQSSWFMFMICVCITIFLAFLQLTTIHEDLIGEVMILVVPLIFLLVILIGTVVFAIKAGTARVNAETQSVKGIKDTDEDKYWKFGLFYFNNNDPSIFVEKRFGIGWTINFANPFGYLIIFGPIIVIFFVTFLV